MKERIPAVSVIFLIILVGLMIVSFPESPYVTQQDYITALFSTAFIVTCVSIIPALSRSILRDVESKVMRHVIRRAFDVLGIMSVMSLMLQWTTLGMLSHGDFEVSPTETIEKHPGIYIGISICTYLYVSWVEKNAPYSFLE